MIYRTEVTVGDSTTGALEVVDSAVANFTADAIIDNAAGSLGIVSVSGATADGTTLDRSTLAANTLTVGLDGVGVLSVNNDGEVIVDGGNGPLLVAAEADSERTVAIGGESGETPLGTGLLSASEIAFGDGNGVLLFNHADNTGSYVFDNKVTGDGSIVAEAGYTSLTGDFSTFDGTIAVDGGTLAVNTTLPSKITKLIRTPQ